MKRLLPACLLLVAALSFAQHGYDAQQKREIKALSAEETGQYQSGAGMGFALAAELNHYPGPMHALELADQLQLSSTQRDGLKALMDSHKAEARAIGSRLIEAERELDRLFVSGQASADLLRKTVLAAGELRSEYRLAHLETHRRTRELLSPGQIARYDHLRGYAGGGSHHK